MGNYQNQYAKTALSDPVITLEIADKNKGGQSCSINSNNTGANFVANPVNTATGNKFEPVTDLTLSTPGIPLEFRRYYNSVVAADGPLGYGWTHNFSMSVEVVQTSPGLRVRVTDTDGRALYFAQIFDGNTAEIHLHGESGVKDRFKKIVSSGQYILRKKDSNLTYLFDSTGRLLSISDANGNTLTLTYQASQLALVSDNFGNSLVIQYNGSRISSIIDPKGQSISYAYTGSDLTQATYPDTNSITYTYDTNHRLTDKKDTSGNIIGHWDYNSDGRVSTYYRYLINGVPQERADFTYTTNTTTLTRSTGATNYTTAINDGINTVIATDGCGSTCGGSEHKTYGYDRWINLTDVTSISSGQSYTTHYTYDNSANFYDLVGEERWYNKIRQ